MVTALALFSGSLASRVAARLVQFSPAVDKIFLLHFRSPFFEEVDGLRDLVKEEWAGTVYRTQSLKNDYRRLANIIPGQHFSLPRSCLSCRTLMLSRAIRFAQRLKADFIVTGEVIGRHGLSESEMERITEDLGISGFVLRPLSARLLPETIPELKDLKGHVAGRMLNHRMSVTFCTDNRLMSATTVTAELKKAVTLFDIEPKRLRDVVITGFKRSFFPGTYADKRYYVRSIIDYYDGIVKRFDG